MPLLNDQDYKNCWKWEPCCHLHNAILFWKFRKTFRSILGVMARISAVIRSFSSSTESTGVRKTQFLRWPAGSSPGDWGLDSSVARYSWKLRSCRKGCAKTRASQLWRVPAPHPAKTSSPRPTCSRAINWVTISRYTSAVTVGIKKLARWSVPGRWRAKCRAFSDRGWFPDTGGGFRCTTLKKPSCWCSPSCETRPNRWKRYYRTQWPSDHWHWGTW